MLLDCQYLAAGRGPPAPQGRATLPRSDTAVSLDSQKLRHRRGLIGAAALAAAVAAGLAATGVAGASAATAPVLQTLTYTATGPGGSLYHPVGVSAAGGTVYVSDTGANLVATTADRGTTRPPASPPAPSSLDPPQNVAVNAAGDVFIADTYNNRVVKVTPQGQVTTVAGDGAAGYSGDGRLAAFAELNEPTGVAVDAKGDLYIADSANNVIRRVDAKTGIITTVAGDVAADKADDGLGGFSGDNGPATRAQLNDPQGIAIDGAGDLFIADTFNNAIREVTTAGVISTVVNAAPAAGGTPPAGSESSGKAPTASKLNTPYGIAIDPSTDDLYIADTDNSKIAEVTGL